MQTAKRMIEVDEDTAAGLERLAAEEGVSLPEFLADVARSEPWTSASPDEIAEHDRAWERIERGEPTVAHDDVVRWLETWGTPAFEPWKER
jgi:predicted transcriptional regulator